MKFGIDKISFYTPQYFLDLKTLADARGIDPDKFYIGIGQEKMGVLPPDEDIVTMGASAAYRIAQVEDLADVELLLFATESGIDQSKSAGVFVHHLLGLNTRCRTVELKQACYSGTAALQLAIGFCARNPSKRALVIASDAARYELDSPGEATQGGGAAAMLISANPRLIAIDPESGYYTQDVMDFWRPNYRSEALVDGKYSTLIYIRALLDSWTQYAEITGRTLCDFKRFCYHIPFTKMADKAHSKLCRKAKANCTDEMREQSIGDSLLYSRIVGNCYSASMYIGLCSLLEHGTEELTGERIGFYSYGSGCVGEFFSGVVQPGWSDHLFSMAHRQMLENRQELTFRQYEDIYYYTLPQDGGHYEQPLYRTGTFRLKGVTDHKREYERNE